MKKSIWLPLIAIVLLWGCRSEKNKGQEENRQEHYVNVAQSVKMEYTPRLDFAGTVMAWKEANLGAALPGRVEKIFYEEGKYVSRGDLLVKLSGEKLAQARAEFNGLKKDLERLTRLKKEGSVSQQDFDHLKAKYEAAKARVEMMEKNTEIHAPFSGTIVSYQVKEGENFFFAPKMKPGYSTTSGIVSLMQLNRLKVEVEINEKVLSKVSVGDSATVVADAYPQDTLKGTVHWIAPTLSTTSRTVKAEIAVPNKDRKFKPGMYAGVNLKLPEETGVFVPLNAIYRLPGTGEDYVFVVQSDDTVIRRPITRKSTRGNMVLVEGVKAGQTLVTDGKTKLSDGNRVHVNN